MKSKILSLFLLTTILSLVMVSAAINYTVSVNDIELTKSDLRDSTTVTINVTNNNALGTYNVTVPEFEDIDINEDIIDIEQDFTGVVEPGDSVEITVSYSTTAELDNLDLGLFLDASSITITDTVEDEIVTLNFLSEFCDEGCVGNDLSMEIEFDVIQGFGDEDENEWYPLDEIEVEVDMENEIDDDIDDVVIEWCLYDTKKNKCIMDDKEDDFKLKEGKDKKVYISFQLDPEDMDEENYVFYVKAYSEDKNYGEDLLCIEYSEEIDIMKDDNFMVLDNLGSTEIIPCDMDLEVSAKVWNIGDEDEEDVYIIIYNKELGINQKIELGEIETFEYTSFSETIKIPEDAEEKEYDLEIRIFDEDEDVFENDNEDEAIFFKTIKVEGNCKGDVTANAQITAMLDPETPEAVAGKQVIIRATLKNTGDAETTYTVSIYGNSAWSNLVAINPQIVTLEAGASKDINIILSLDNDVGGDKEFTIKTSYEEDQLTEKTIILTVEKPADKGLLTGSAIANHVRNNSFVYAIGLINLILIIAIISVVKRSLGTQIPEM